MEDFSVLNSGNSLKPETYRRSGRPRRHPGVVCIAVVGGGPEGEAGVDEEEEVTVVVAQNERLWKRGGGGDRRGEKWKLNIIHK